MGCEQPTSDASDIRTPSRHCFHSGRGCFCCISWARGVVRGGRSRLCLRYSYDSRAAMDANEPLQPPDDPNLNAKRRCFCCGRKYGTRQLARHLREFLARLDQEIAAGQVVGDDEGSGDEDENDNMGAGDEGGGPGPDYAAMDIDHAGPGNVAVNIDNVVGAEGPMEDPNQVNAHLFDDIAPVAGRCNVQPYVEPELIHEPRHNPPVDLFQWPDPDSDASSEPSLIEEPANEADQDPPFEELPDQPVNANLDPIHEPDMADAQIYEIMRLELGGLADDEWLNLYDQVLSKKDENTFRFIATRLRTHFSRQTYDELRYGP
ncbi:hypothetical protein BDV93DRAFT_575338 [Ceratobasidium sp. AG-I]|nr:hypothetical protein BDV93DRAFT_575338 [Ceratobasidium sp. AG-I]